MKRGFRIGAKEDPERTALVAADGTSGSGGEVDGYSRPLIRELRAWLEQNLDDRFHSANPAIDAPPERIEILRDRERR